MSIAYITINIDGFTGADAPPLSRYATITLDPGVDHVDTAADVIHVRSITVTLDATGRAATANGQACVDGRVPVVAGVTYAVSAPSVLRGGPHVIPALVAGEVKNLADLIVPGAPLTPDQAAALAARVTALEATPPGRRGLKVRRTAALALPTASVAQVPWDTEDLDTDGYHAAGAAGITIPAGLGGVYAITLTVTRTAGLISGRSFLQVAGGRGPMVAGEDVHTLALCVEVTAGAFLTAGLYTSAAGVSVTAALEAYLLLG